MNRVAPEVLEDLRKTEDVVDVLEVAALEGEPHRTVLVVEGLGEQRTCVVCGATSRTLGGFGSVKCRRR